MARRIEIVHHRDRRTDVHMPYAPGILVAQGGWSSSPASPPRRCSTAIPTATRSSTCPTACASRHGSPWRISRALEAAGCTLRDLVSATRYLTAVDEQDDLNRVWAEYLAGHLPTTTTVEVSRLATHARCKLEISAIAVADG